ncbi:MAG: SMP-30/gluconolactonase/LRE family protein [Sphingomonadales bacterium]|nr:SMP-30/gluconolactonase/LRE family protein [Sphingomonadales bacterium]
MRCAAAAPPTPCRRNRHREAGNRGVIPELVWPVGALLGEGPAWFPDEGALRFVDIKGGRIHRFVPETGACETLQTGGQPSFIVPEHGGGLLAGNGSAIHRVGANGFGDVVARIDQPAHNRTNDATVDREGRLWLGTMDDGETRPTGALHCLDRGTLHHLGHEAVVTNGPAITADGKTLYFVDSGARTIWRLTLGEGLQVRTRTVFVQLGEGDGHPDGVVLDSEDCLWVALWDGWGVRRYAPDGTLLAQVDFPCARVTKLAFGGPDLRTAYVTTARVGLDEAARTAQPLAGGLFTFAAPVAGRALPAVRL